ncbi:MAG: peptidase MA family metallohydrolase [Chloroflexota bacterium]
MRRLLPLAIATFLLAFPAARPAAAASISFERPTATATFGEGIVFTQASSSLIALARVELLLDFPDSLGPHVVQVAGATAPGDHTFFRDWSVAGDGHLYPNTTVTVRWRLVPADRALGPVIGPPATVTYADTRFAWKTLQGDVVRIHWYEGSESFGRRALEIGETAVREAADFLGVTESERIDFLVYADRDAFYDAVGPGTRENVVGTPISSIRTMFALIPPNDVAGAEVARTVPHELIHLVFDTAVRNPYHFPPRWLNEGVATYLSEGFTPSYRASVEAAAPVGRLMPLRALAVQFPTTYERFSLAYGESVSAVDYLVREQGTGALVTLIRSYADGVTDDEAFSAAVGTDLAGFETSWLADLGAEPPTRHGPQPGAAGPLPPGWETDASPAPPLGSATPGASPGVSPGPGPGGPTDDGGSPFGEGLILLVAALAGLLVGGSLAFVRRRRRARIRAQGGDGADGAVR